MRRIDFVTLKLFVAIADERSLTRAAEREHLALAAVSKRVSDLENQLGIALLYRQPKGVELTPAGQRLLQHARLIMRQVDYLKSEFAEYGTDSAGHIRIFANTTAVTEFLPEVLAGFLAERPGVTVDLQERLSRDIVRGVLDGAADLGIIAGPAVMNLAGDHSSISLLSEIGITVLLFVVGLKLDMHLVRTLGPVALATGLGQLSFTIVAGLILCRLLGLDWASAGYVAVALTFSSTIIIVKLLSDKGEIDSLHGRIAMGFLIVQDIAVVLAMLVISLYQPSHGTHEGLSPLALIGALLVGGAGVWGTRRALNASPLTVLREV